MVSSTSNTAQSLKKRFAAPVLVAGLAAVLAAGCSDSDDSSDGAGSSGDWSGAKASCAVWAMTCTAMLMTLLLM